MAKLLQHDIPLLHRHPLVFRECLQTLVRNGRQHRRALGRHISLLFVINPDEIARAEFLHHGVRRCVEVQTDRVPLLLRLHVRDEIRRVISSHLGRSYSQRSGTVVVFDDEAVDGLGEPTLVVVADGDDEDDEGVFFGGLEANFGAGAKEERTKVEGAAGTIRGDVGDVVLHDVIAGFDEGVDGDFGHHDAICAIVDALGIFIWSKHVYRTIFVCKCLEPLKTRLTIMKGCCTNMNTKIGRLDQLRLSPFSILVNHLQMRLGRTEFESQLRPRQVGSAWCSHFRACGGYRQAAAAAAPRLNVCSCWNWASLR
mmetsp:Transcript_29990/g.55196  ORF Transcript_29990/g.55196 Transcript_29990/m.55196 type:complete len:312 (+) Transcript_29990:284-1219(+)